MEYRVVYRSGEVTAQWVGFTDSNDNGQEGMELVYDTLLTGEAGAKKVVQDRAGRVINDISLIKSARSGEDLRLSIDLRVQYAAYRALKQAVTKHSANSGSVVVLDVITGEVLAMVNQPSFNPNDRSYLSQGSIRNRAMTDVMEPGSTVKPFTIFFLLNFFSLLLLPFFSHLSSLFLNLLKPVTYFSAMILFGFGSLILL